jgi:putative membrane protein insertion efficiency factor
MNYPGSDQESGLSSPQNRQQLRHHLQHFVRNGCVSPRVTLFLQTPRCTILGTSLMSFFLCIPIYLYRWLISPLLHTLAGGSGCGCRFHPTCSAYALDALSSHGSLKGTWLSLCRISKCHPWGNGGYDPVPPSLSNTQRLHTTSFNH